MPVSSSEALMRETRAASDNIRESLAAELERSEELVKLLDDERESCSEAQNDCATLASKVLELKNSLSRVESQLHLTAYVPFSLLITTVTDFECI